MGRALQGELSELRRMLKPDGYLCVVQHWARPWADGDYTDGSKGYTRQSDAIGAIEAYGYQLLETSEINANPRDPASDPEGV
jgi:predicted methyltransferase